VRQIKISAALLSRYYPSYIADWNQLVWLRAINYIDREVLAS